MALSKVCLLLYTFWKCKEKNNLPCSLLLFLQLVVLSNLFAFSKPCEKGSVSAAGSGEVVGRSVGLLKLRSKMHV